MERAGGAVEVEGDEGVGVVVAPPDDDDGTVAWDNSEASIFM